MENSLTNRAPLKTIESTKQVNNAFDVIRELFQQGVNQEANQRS